MKIIKSWNAFNEAQTVGAPTTTQTGNRAPAQTSAPSRGFQSMNKVLQRPDMDWFTSALAQFNTENSQTKESVKSFESFNRLFEGVEHQLTQEQIDKTMKEKTPTNLKLDDKDKEISKNVVTGGRKKFVSDMLAKLKNVEKKNIVGTIIQLLGYSTAGYAIFAGVTGVFTFIAPWAVMGIATMTIVIGLIFCAICFFAGYAIKDNM